ncbi:hypothetical protein [Paenibacillus periandrae]|uniref:hypothetical protein n=1 Tax=Paenibacillus periandrae TaxID=1761741 RepID=UPI001F08C35D|nr:hypothetical protein [Paenibacillus periandrae]
MLHTVHMFCEIDYFYYEALFNSLKKLSKSNGAKFYKEKDGTYHCHLLQKNGLILILRQVKSSYYSGLEIIMNPIRLLYGNENDAYFLLADMKHYRAICKAFVKLFKPIKQEFERIKGNKHHKFKLHMLNSYSFKRVDFAVNIYTEHIKFYMELIKRANIPDDFHLFVKDDPASKRKKPPKDSFYIFKKDKKGKATLTINCYNKGKQLKDEQLPCDDEELAKSTIRFEVQCRYTKVYNLLKVNDSNEPDFWKLLKKQLSDNILHYYFNRTIGYGDYVPFPKAREIIRSKRMKQEKKDALIGTLELVNKKRGIWKARETVSDKKKFDKHIKELHQLGVNPVTIPLDWKIGYLPCLFDLMQYE